MMATLLLSERNIYNIKLAILKNKSISENCFQLFLSAGLVKETAATDNKNAIHTHIMLRI